MREHERRPHGGELGREAQPEEMDRRPLDPGDDRRGGEHREVARTDPLGQLVLRDRERDLELVAGDEAHRPLPAGERLAGLGEPCVRVAERHGR